MTHNDTEHLDHEGNYLEVGDAVESVEPSSLGERGEVRELLPNGAALVAWEQGVTTPTDCSALALV